jgi:hypothetical protein
MNHKLWNAVAARVIAVSFVVAGLAACSERLSNTHTGKAPSNPADQSAVVIGTAPAQPSGDPPGTTPVASNTTEITKKVESEQKPQEGDNHSYSSLAPDNPQKAGGQDAQGQSGKKD